MNMEIGTKDIRIVIDPGHGGEENGAEWEGRLEKDINLITANAIKEYLENFDNIEVYMTRVDDVKLTLAERAAIAEELEADFLFCIHYNMSEYHRLFGSEIWVSAFDRMYQEGYSFAQIAMEELTADGLYYRGIKTRIGQKGTDYYGIIRNCTEYEIPSVIIEHCHLDEERDAVFCDTEEELIQFGIKDATAIAKYFGLKSESLGIDYSNYEVPLVELPIEVMRPDITPPDYCKLTLKQIDDSTGEITILLEAADRDTEIHYFDISTDGGESWSILQPFDGKTTSYSYIPEEGVAQEVVVRAYNLYDLTKESNRISIEPFFSEKGESEEKETEELTVSDDAIAEHEDITSETEAVTAISLYDSISGKEDTLILYGLLGLICSLIIVLLVFLLALSTDSRKKKRRRKAKRKHKQHDSLWSEDLE